MRSRILFFMLLAASITACQSKKPCKYGTPTAIFSKTTAGVTRHQFEQNKENALEKLRLDSIFFHEMDAEKKLKLYIPIELEIIQAGCEEPVKEFRIEFFDAAAPMPKNFPAPDCANIIAQIFGNLSSLSPNAIPFASLADEILKKQSQFEYGNAVKFPEGLTVQMDKVHSSESTIVTLILKEEADK